MQNRIDIRFALVLGGLLLAFPSDSACAHGIGAEVKQKDNRIEVEAFFDDDAPAADAAIKILAESEKVIAEGKTDAAGRWSCPAPPAGKYRVVVEAAGGHRVRKSFEVLPPEQIPTAESFAREEFTGSAKWAKAAGGLAFLFALFAVWRWRHRRSEPSNSIDGG